MNSRTEPATGQTHLEALNRVAVHIQGHLDGALSLDELAVVARFSPFHFHRLFQAYMGETVHSYVRRLRLERAAARLISGTDPITDIALAAGYDTPAAFTRAFRQLFGRTPTSFRSRRLPPPSGPRPTCHEEKAMEPEIRDVAPQSVIFVRRVGRYDKAAKEAWSAVMSYAYKHRLMGKKTRSIGISHDSPDITPEDKLRYDACVTVDRPVQPEGEVGVGTIEGGKYAVFLHKGPYDKFSQTYGNIFSCWLPASGCKLREAPCFEVYLNHGPLTLPALQKTEIWVPIE